MDKFYVYRPLLNLIGFTEGTDKGRGYNETLGYGAYTGGDVNLVGMTLGEIDKLQTKMLRHPKNKFKSSALGRYQIVRTTLRTIKATLGLADTVKFNELTQDQMGCFLLGQRGVDKYLAGRLKEDTLINNLAKEWASFPTTENKGYYAGQHTPIRAERVRKTLAEVKQRHVEGQPKETVEIDKPVVPESVEKKVKEKSNWWTWLTGFFGSGAIGLGWLNGMDWQAILAGGVVLILLILVLLLLRSQIIAAVRQIKSEVDNV